LNAKVNENFVIEIMDEEEKKSGFEVCGDLLFRLVNIKNGQLICRFALNTSFINEETNIYEFTK
jgi:negative regulator of genetic competence, sporulation and motility